MCGLVNDTGIKGYARFRELRRPHSPCLNLVFRPFFSAAAVFAIVAIGLWMAMFCVFRHHLRRAGSRYALAWPQMVFGYAMAVIAGFCLRPSGTGPGRRVCAVAPCWDCWWPGRWRASHSLAKRISTRCCSPRRHTLRSRTARLGGAQPVVQSQAVEATGILVKLVLLLASNLALLRRCVVVCPDVAMGPLFGTVSGACARLAMARRVVPFFIERGVDEAFEARNRAWVDVGSMLLFLVWAVLSDVFFDQVNVVGALSLLLFLLHMVRLRDWFTPVTPCAAAGLCIWAVDFSSSASC